MQDIQNNSSYDEIIYDKLPHKQGNLRLLETIGDLYGIEPVDIHHCRVLELGTATGKTIIPQAEEFPESQFLGIDLSPAQINAGNETVRSLNLHNIELRAANIMDIDESWGQFDYIIAHGIYSWVPPMVQDKMLDVCRTNLSPHGVAMYSYNTYPGWLFSRYARDLMCFHTKRANVFDAKTAISEARASMDFAVEFTAKRNDYFANTLAWCQEHVKKASDHYLAHEHLETFNAPCYFSEFCRRLEEKDLQCVSDFHWVRYHDMKHDGRLRTLVKGEPNDVVLEQYCDFLLNQTFRSSLICRRDLTVQIREQSILNRYHFYLPVGCSIKKVESEGEQPAGWQFTMPNGSKISISRSPLLDLVCEYFISNRDGFFTVNDLCQTVLPKLQGKGETKEHLDVLGTTFSRMVRAGIVQIVLHPPTDRTSDLRRPYARTFVRQMLKRDAPAVPNAMFEAVGVDALARKLIKQFDGRRSVTDHILDVQKDMQKGRIKVAQNGLAIEPDDRDTLTAFVENVIQDWRNKRLVF
jgi:methyltransferase-like protein/2-polyprenyl-3-methyl-5-hydroxy-6-metoxy-1,4-benzoquinol methylase